MTICLTSMVVAMRITVRVTYISPLHGQLAAQPGLFSRLTNMGLRLVAFFVCAVLSLGVKAADWYTVEWDAP